MFVWTGRICHYRGPLLLLSSASFFAPAAKWRRDDGVEAVQHESKNQEDSNACESIQYQSVQPSLRRLREYKYQECHYYDVASKYPISKTGVQPLVAVLGQ